MRREFKVGERFNSLVFIKEVEPVKRKSQTKSGIGYERVMLWECDCGNKKEIRMSSVITGRTKTCGCLQKDVCRKLLTTHGLTEHPLRIVHRNMILRCYNKKSNKVDYNRYGGRGITVCDEWRYSLTAFVEWAELNGYEPGLTIDRENNNGNYEPNNCRFVNRTVQNNNRRSNRIVILNNVKYTLEQYCERYNLNRKTATKYLNAGLNTKEVVIKMKNYKHINKLKSKYKKYEERGQNINSPVV